MPDQTPGKLILPQNTPSNYTESSADLDGHLDGIDTELGVQAAADAALPQHKFNAVIAPIVTDDAAGGFSVGSRFVDINTNRHYTCVDSTNGAAIWLRTDRSEDVSIVTFDAAGDWTGAGPFTMTKAHGFTGVDVFLVVRNASDELVIDESVTITVTATNVVLSVATAPEQFAGTLVVSSGSVGGDGLTPAEILAALVIVDGAGSLLDADLLDGEHASAFADAVHTHIIANVTGLQAALDLKAPITSPSFLGSPLAPTPAAVDNSTRIATTQWVTDRFGSGGILWDEDTTHHIYISADGNDTSGDGSPGAPLQTVNEGISNHKAATGMTVFHIKGTVTETSGIDIIDNSDIAIVGDGPHASTLVVTGIRGIHVINSVAQNNTIIANLTIANLDDLTQSTVVRIVANNADITNFVMQNVILHGRGDKLLDILNGTGNIVHSSFRNIELEWDVTPTVAPTNVRAIDVSDYDGTPFEIQNVRAVNLGYVSGAYTGATTIIKFDQDTTVTIKNLTVVGTIPATVTGAFSIIESVSSPSVVFNIVNAYIDVVAVNTTETIRIMERAVFSNVTAKLKRTLSSSIDTRICSRPQSGSTNMHLEMTIVASASFAASALDLSVIDIQADDGTLGNIVAVFISDVAATFTLSRTGTDVLGAVFIANFDGVIENLTARVENIGLGNLTGAEAVHYAMSTSKDLLIQDLIATLVEPAAGGTIDVTSVALGLHLAAGTSTLHIGRGILSYFNTASPATILTNTVFGEGAGTQQLARSTTTSIDRRGFTNAQTGVSLLISTGGGNV